MPTKQVWREALNSIPYDKYSSIKNNESFMNHIRCILCELAKGDCRKYTDCNNCILSVIFNIFVYYNPFDIICEKIKPCMPFIYDSSKANYQRMRRRRQLYIDKIIPAFEALDENHPFFKELDK